MENDSYVNEKKSLKIAVPENYEPILKDLGFHSIYFDRIRKKSFLLVNKTQEKVETVEQVADIIAAGGNPFGDGVDIDCFGELQYTESTKPHYEEKELTKHIVSSIKFECRRQKVSTEDIYDTIEYMADANQRCLISEWILSKEWDGTPRLQDWYNTIDCGDGFDIGLQQAYMMRWAISAVAMLFSNGGATAHGVLVLQGEQGLGKTSWVKKLCPAYHWAIGTGVCFDPHSKDSKELVYSRWINELGELDSTMRKDIGALKAEITKDYDEWRASYGRIHAGYIRRTVFCASVNDANFLKDPTGNRRFWVLPAKSIEYDHNIDMQQLWAEVYYLYQNGVHWHLSAEESSQQRYSARLFEELCPLQELLASQINWGGDARQWMNATQVAKMIGIKEPKKSDTNTIARLLREKFTYTPEYVKVTAQKYNLFSVPVNIAEPWTS